MEGFLLEDVTHQSTKPIDAISLCQERGSGLARRDSNADPCSGAKDFSNPVLGLLLGQAVHPPHRGWQRRARAFPRSSGKSEGGTSATKSNQESGSEAESEAGGREARVEEACAEEGGRKARAEEACAEEGGRKARAEEACGEEGGREARAEEACAEEGGRKARAEEACGEEGGREARAEEACGEEGGREACGPASRSSSRGRAGDGRRVDRVRQYRARGVPASRPTTASAVHRARITLDQLPRMEVSPRRNLSRSSPLCDQYGPFLHVIDQAEFFPSTTLVQGTLDLHRRPPFRIGLSTRTQRDSSCSGAAPRGAEASSPSG